MGASLGIAMAVLDRWQLRSTEGDLERESRFPNAAWHGATIQGSSGAA
jgi:hypothetical protein